MAACFHVKLGAAKYGECLITGVCFVTHCKFQVKEILLVDVILCDVVSVKSLRYI